ncbi:hypothetical protein AX774_g1688 [Zancudomyces culisetae]|uniref:Uncharacterized protein n=1 Tax=Zancudomyces culisetae TaxID=1213189 RepID=A0A1R1PUY4_ZANCU|nr:hypothetical protein AX774_g4564 [Zancudomyces culisetae]OMH84781.1 hypothetical protein AX774_g1688 [Zancudomyces culisetae]|eukprot:OMH81967.1 hypothetical protein AX774_g4564 [Zancudomyces culisetae]
MTVIGSGQNVLVGTHASDFLDSHNIHIRKAAASSPLERTIDAEYTILDRDDHVVGYIQDVLPRSFYSKIRGYDDGVSYIVKDVHGENVLSITNSVPGKNERLVIKGFQGTKKAKTIGYCYQPPGLSNHSIKLSLAVNMEDFGRIKPKTGTSGIIAITNEENERDVLATLSIKKKVSGDEKSTANEAQNDIEIVFCDEKQQSCSNPDSEQNVPKLGTKLSLEQKAIILSSVFYRSLNAV